MSIPFTQYVLPHGRTRVETIDRPPNIEAMASDFIAGGGKYECEILTTGEVSFTAMKVDQTVAIVVCSNGPEIPLRIDELVRQSIVGSAL